ncbi:MAG: hypothetical protein ACYTAS_14870, partial [Planctomycetota bacterium]
MAAGRQHDLKLGESIPIKRGLMTKVSLLYAGMPNERTFSVVVTTTAGHMGMGYNLYLPAGEREVRIAGASITVHSVSPTTLLLTVN